MPYEWDKPTDYCNWGFTLFFLIELLIKFTGLGPRLYVSDNMNIFDAFVTVRAAPFATSTLCICLGPGYEGICS